MTLLTVQDVSKSYRTRRGAPPVQAVREVSFDLPAGRTLAVVGESGAGKSTLGRLVLRLVEPDTGEITLDGTDVRAATRSELRGLRRRMQMIFQDPFNSLDPRYTMLQSVMEPLKLHTDAGPGERADRAIDLMKQVGMGSEHAYKLPRQMSGGQLQRISIARALAVEPQVIVCDEPVAALDMSIRAQVLNLLADLQEQRGLSYLFITHDLSTTSVVAHRVMVMRGGSVVEEGAAEQVFSEPREPYTRELLSAVPTLSVAS